MIHVCILVVAVVFEFAFAIFLGKCIKSGGAAE